MRRARSGQGTSPLSRLVLIPGIGSEGGTALSPLCFYSTKLSTPAAPTPQSWALPLSRWFWGQQHPGVGCPILHQGRGFVPVTSPPHGDTAGAHQGRYQGVPRSQRGPQQLFVPFRWCSKGWLNLHGDIRAPNALIQLCCGQKLNYLSPASLLQLNSSPCSHLKTQKNLKKKRRNLVVVLIGTKQSRPGGPSLIHSLNNVH